MSFIKHDPQALDQFRKYAETTMDTAKKTFGFDLSYDQASINKLDEMVEGIGKPKNLELMILLFGSFLGEAFRHMYNGRWKWDERHKSWAVTYPLGKGGEDGAFVFAKVEKRFKNGKEDSLSFYAEVTDKRVRGIIP